MKLPFRRVVGYTEAIQCFPDGSSTESRLMGSDRDWDTVVWRTLGELRAGQGKIANASVRGPEESEGLNQAGYLLAAYPEYLIQEGEDSVVNGGFSRQPQVYIWNDADIFRAREIRKLNSEIRKEIHTIANLTTTLRNLGH